MRINNNVFMSIFALFLAITFFSVDAQAQMKKPKMDTISGTLIDLTCASKGMALMGKWRNVQDDHMTPEGAQKRCATMCLKGGQPAALFAKNKIAAVFACNPQATLSNYAAQKVDVQGYWAGVGSDNRPFFPTKIRSGGGSWVDVNCATMH